MMCFQIGLLTGICLTAILGVSFGSLATLFTQDIEVLQVVRTGVLVSMVLHIYMSAFVCLRYCFTLLSVVVASLSVLLNHLMHWLIFLMVSIMVFLISHMLLSPW